MSTLRAGDLKRPITIQAVNTAQDAYGQPLTTFTTVVSTWACIQTVTSREVYALTGSGFTEQVTHKITIRCNPTLTLLAGMQVLYRGRTFRVQTVSDPDEERILTNLMCLELSK